MDSTFKILSERLKFKRFFELDRKELKELFFEYEDLNRPYVRSDIPHGIRVSKHIKPIIFHDDSSDMKFLIYKKITNEFIGLCGITTDFENLSGKLFYILTPYHKGYGYAIESIKLLIKYGFTELNLNLIKAEIPVDLKEAWKPVERAGMAYMGDYQGKNQKTRFLLFIIDKKEYLNQALY
jgi:RimJ/RimL family protein N-acetyltransferase